MIEARLPREVLEALPDGLAVERCEVGVDGGNAPTSGEAVALTGPSGNIVATPSDIEAVRVLVRTLRGETAVLALQLLGERESAWRERIGGEASKP